MPAGVALGSVVPTTFDVEPERFHPINTLPNSGPGVALAGLCRVNDAGDNMTSTRDDVGPTTLSAHHYALGAFQVLELSGECDMANHDDVRAEFDHALGVRPTALILDLTQMRFCDGDCAGLILDAARHTRLAAVGLAGTAALVFDVLDRGDDLPRHRTINDAACALSDIKTVTTP